MFKRLNIAVVIGVIIGVVVGVSIPRPSYSEESLSGDLVSYTQFERMSRIDQDQYLDDVREALETLSQSQNQYDLPLVVDGRINTLIDGRKNQLIGAFLDLLSETAEAKSCSVFNGETFCLERPSAAKNEISNHSTSTRSLTPTAPEPVSPRATSAMTRAMTAPPRTKTTKATAPRSSCSTVPKKDQAILTKKYREGAKSQCIYGGYISQQASVEGPASPYLRGAHGCRPVRQDKYEGESYKCSGSKQILCNPLLFGLSGTGSAICVDPQKHATLACGQQTRAEQKKYGKSYQDWQTKFRQMGSVQEHWNEFSSQLSSLCSDKDFGAIHCEECGYFRGQLKAAAAKAKTLRIQPTSPTTDPTSNKRVE